MSVSGTRAIRSTMHAARARPECPLSELRRMHRRFRSSNAKEHSRSSATSMKSRRSRSHSMRRAKIQRDTKETRISGRLTIEGKGRYDIATGIRFFDHMLELFTKHGGFDLELHADGDLDVDQHRSEERRVGKECRSRWGTEH